LHRTDFDKPDDRHQVQAHLAKLVDGYDRKRGKTFDFNQIMPLVPAAEERAELQLARREEEGDPPSSPFTTVFRLTRSIRAAHKAHTR
jgi:hypothetical protein